MNNNEERTEFAALNPQSGSSAMFIFSSTILYRNQAELANKTKRKPLRKIGLL